MPKVQRQAAKKLKSAGNIIDGIVRVDELGVTGYKFLVYGLSGTGKTSFAATFPKPLLVLFFDSPGKDVWFQRQFDKFKRVEGETEEGMLCVQYIKE